MTEEAFQAARKIMQKANYYRGLITVAKGNVAKWTKIEATYRSDFRETRADGAKKMLDIAMGKLKKRREEFAALKFPESDMVTPVNRCKDCGCKIAEGNEYCGECMCEDDSGY